MNHLKIKLMKKIYKFALDNEKLFNRNQKEKKTIYTEKKHLNDNRIICAKKKIVCKSTHNIQVRLVEKMF